MYYIEFIEQEYFICLCLEIGIFLTEKDIVNLNQVQSSFVLEMKFEACVVLKGPKCANLKDLNVNACIFETHFN